MYDVAIVGAGPAGATLARMIGRKYKVLLIDKRKLSEPPQKNSPVKCCGGLVAPDAQKMLGRMGLALPKEVLVGPQIFTVRTIDMDNSLERFYQRFYINVDREKFDRWLVSTIPTTVDFRDGCYFKHFERTEVNFENFLELYNRRALPLKGNIFLKNTKAPFMYLPIVRKAVMRSGIQSMQVE